MKVQKRHPHAELGFRAQGSGLRDEGPEEAPPCRVGAGD